jgi:methionyl-tRNA synthetase
VFAHGGWTNEGQKISKSLGNVIDPVPLVEEFGLDALRYFLLREVPFGQDGDFSRGALVNRLNGELADALGNLANRTLSLIQRNCEGRLPPPAPRTEADAAFLGGFVDGLPARMGAAIDAQEFHLALEAAFSAVREANGYITREAPWALKKTNPERMVHVLRHLHDALRVFATVLTPFMPGAMGGLFDQLGLPRMSEGQGSEGRGLAALSTPLPGGLTLPAPEPLFRKVEA